MVPLLIILFVGVPFAELYVLIQVGRAIGVFNTLGLLLLVSIVGAWLAKREGIGVIRRMQAALQAGRVPGTELVDGFLILLAAALMLTPGFLTDVVAILLLLPPVRAGVRRAVRRHFARR
ncbi:MAG TPA: FxsA family protein, partial [Acidimicrobiia bacterium]|nr:FxsA family protein [Acidimicrobiia bacterium]